jgi:hypothetical protein
MDAAQRLGSNPLTSDIPPRLDIVPRPEIPQGSLWADDVVAAQWHPRIAQFFTYWRAIRPASGLPGRKHFDPLAIYGLLPGIWLLDVQHEPFRLRYRLVGTEAVEAIGTEVTGQWMDEAHPAVSQTPGYLDRYRAVVRQKIPSWRRGTPQLWTHKKYGTLENMVAPLASDGVTVDILVALTVFHAQPLYDVAG